MTPPNESAAPADLTTKTVLRPEIDLLIRIVLGTIFAFLAGIYIKNAVHEFQLMADNHDNPGLILSRSLSILAVGFFTMMIGLLYGIRLKPVSPLPAVWPSFIALVGGFLPLGLLFLPLNRDLPLGWQVTAFLMVITGYGISAYILFHLGRSFSILPEGRKLVTTGPYSKIRHPLYLAEALATLGAMITFFSPLAVAIIIIQFGLQIVRLGYEEKILSQAFPDQYPAYAQRTARLIPGIY